MYRVNAPNNLLGIEQTATEFDRHQIISTLSASDAFRTCFILEAQNAGIYSLLGLGPNLQKILRFVVRLS